MGLACNGGSVITLSSRSASWQGIPGKGAGHRGNVGMETKGEEGLSSDTGVQRTSKLDAWWANFSKVICDRKGHRHRNSGGARDSFLAGAKVGLSYPVMVLRDERLSRFYVPNSHCNVISRHIAPMRMNVIHL